MPHRNHAEQAAASLTASGSILKLVRQLSKLATGDKVAREAHSACRVTRGHAVTALEEGRTHSQGVGDGDVQTYDSFLEPDEYDDHLCRETSVTFGGPRLGRTLGLSRVNSMHNLRGSQLAPESSQGYLARTLVDEGSQAVMEEVEPEALHLLKTAHQAQQAEIAALTACLNQKEQQLQEALTTQQQVLAQTAEHAKQQTHALAVSQAQAAELQAVVQHLDAHTTAACDAAVAGLEAQLQQAQHRVAELEAQVADLEVEKNQAQERCLQLEQAAASVDELLRVAPGMLEAAEDRDLSDPQHSGTAAAVEKLIAQLTALQEMYLAESRQRRELHNQLMDLKGAIRVFCRVRPPSLAEEAAQENMACKSDPATDSVEVTCGRVGGIAKDGRLSGDLKQLRFSFDQVYGHTSTQEDVFRETCAIATSVLDGFNACIFAYGQTGSGKTFTMEGTPEERGINYRTMEELFCLANKRSAEARYSIYLSAVEVYLEELRDLLGGGKRLEIRAGPGGVQMPGLEEVEVSSTEQAWDQLQKASAARHAAETRMNAHSSRSHCLLCLRVDGKSHLTNDAWRSRLWLIDLAGSERVSKTEASGERLKEAQSINKSLSALGDCIYALATKGSHVPFRNSKLTYMLQDSLAGAGKTLMIVCCSPSEGNASETVCSLNFASRVRGVELGAARRNVVAETGSNEAVKELKAAVGELQEQVAELGVEKRALSEHLLSSRQQVQHLQAQLALTGSPSPGHHRSDTACSLSVRTKGQGSPSSTGSRPGSGGSHTSRCGRSLSAPELDGGDKSAEATPASPIMPQPPQRRLPSPGFLLSELEATRQQGEAVGGCRSPHDSSDSRGSAPAPCPSRLKPLVAASAPQPGQRPKTPTMPRLVVGAGTASPSAVKSKDQLQTGGQLRNMEQKRPPSSPNSSRSPRSPGRVGGSGYSSPNGITGSGSSIKAWRPETALGGTSAKDANRGRWS